MPTLNANIWYRPVRVGWCVAEGDWEGLRKAWGLTHTLWGGRYNPVIPIGTGNNGAAERLISAFEVDYLFPISDAKEVKSLLKRMSYLKWHGNLDKHPSLFLSIGDEKASFLLDVYHAIRLVSQRDIARVDRLRPEAMYIIPEEDDPLRDIVAATYGYYPTPREAGRDYRGLLRDFMGAATLHLEPSSPIPSNSHFRTPNSISSLDLQPDRRLGSWGKPGFFIGNIGRFMDLVRFWNLRAANINLCFFDPNEETRLTRFRESLLGRGEFFVADHLAHQDLNVWYATTGPTVAIEGLERPARVFVFSDDIWGRSGLRPPQMRWRSYPMFGISADVGSSTTPIPLQQKPFEVSDSNREEITVVVEFSPGPGSGEISFRVPNIAPLAPTLSLQSLIEEKIRIGERGTRYITHVASDAVQIRGWDATSLVRAIFEIAGVKATPSPAGKRATRLIQQLGGLIYCDVLRVEGVRSLLRYYSASQAFSRAEALRHIGERFSSSENVSTVPHKKLKLAPQDIFDHLVEKGVFRIGLKFECTHCGLGFWRSLDEATTLVACEYCAAVFHAGRQLGSAQPWWYRRSGLFGADDDQQGAVPVALTLHRLFATARIEEGYLWIAYSTGMDLERISASIPKCETDLVVVTQTPEGTVHVLIGECKTSSRIEAQDVQNLGAVANALHSIGIQAYVLFSKLSGISPDELELIRQLNDTHDPRVILLTPRELEPAYIYDVVDESDEGVHGGSHRFDGLSRVTQRLYLSS